MIGRSPAECSRLAVLLDGPKLIKVSAMVAPEKTAPQAPSAKSPQFAGSVRGYDKRQVDERLAELSTELKQTSRNRDEAVATAGELTKALGHAQKELDETKAALVRMSASPSGAGAMAERVRMMMQLAEEEIADLKAAAEADAKSTRAEADRYAHETQRASDKAAKDAQAESERLNSEAAQKRKELDMESVRTRAAADKKAEEASAARRAEAEKVAADKIAEADRVSADKRAEAERLSAEKIAKSEKSSAEDIAAKQEQVAEALTDAKTKQAEAQQARKLALELRSKVAERLSATDVAVQEAIKLLAPAPEAPAAAAAPKAAEAPKPVPAKTNGPRPS